MQLQESGEMYLETIYVLSKTGKRVRSIDIAEQMGFSKPSVSRAVSILKEGGFLKKEDSGALVLTPDGLEVAKTIYERHTVLTSVLMSLGVREECAVNDACKMEHIISAESFEAIKAHVAKQSVKEKK